MRQLTRLCGLLLTLASPMVAAAAAEGCGEPVPTTVENEDVGIAAKPEVTPIATVARQPSRFRDVELRLIGELDNEGDNYFTDLRVVLRDGEGASVHVVPWLPTHTPPAPPGASARRPELLSDFLGKRVELVGRLEERRLRSVGMVFALVVSDARVVESDSPDEEQTVARRHSVGRSG